MKLVAVVKLITKTVNWLKITFISRPDGGGVKGRCDEGRSPGKGRRRSSNNSGHHHESKKVRRWRNGRKRRKISFILFLQVFNPNGTGLTRAWDSPSTGNGPTQLPHRQIHYFVGLKHFTKIWFFGIWTLKVNFVCFSLIWNNVEKGESTLLSSHFTYFTGLIILIWVRLWKMGWSSVKVLPKQLKLKCH